MYSVHKYKIVSSMDVILLSYPSHCANLPIFTVYAVKEIKKVVAFHETKDHHLTQVHTGRRMTCRSLSRSSSLKQNVSLYASHPQDKGRAVFFRFLAPLTLVSRSFSDHDFVRRPVSVICLS